MFLELGKYIRMLACHSYCINVYILYTNKSLSRKGNGIHSRNFNSLSKKSVTNCVLMPKTYIHVFINYNASLQPQTVSRLPHNVFVE